MSVIYLVRHGQGSFGTANYDQLSPLGREQSRLVGEHFASMGETIHGLYAGSLQRQRETAELLAQGLGKDAPERLPVHVEPAFDEYEGDTILQAFADTLTPAQRTELDWPNLLRDRKRFQRFLERAARAWVDGVLPGETVLPWTGFRDRIVLALEAIMKREGRGKTLAICTSGGVIGTAVAHVLGLSNFMAIELNWAVHNASLTKLVYSDDKISLGSFNALPHLERADRKQLITYR